MSLGSDQRSTPECCPECGEEGQYYPEYDRICCEACGKATPSKPNAFMDERTI